MKDFLKENKGVAGTDALIAVLIIALFTGLIVTISYNIYLSNTSLKRMTTANSYVIDILEYADKLYYDDLTTTTKLKQKCSYLDDVNAQNVGTPEDENVERMWKLEGEINKGYNVEIVLDKYKPDEDALDLVRKITVTVHYKVSNKNQKIEISRIKARENLEVPNKPDLDLLASEKNSSSQIIYAIKLVNEQYVVCDTNDKDWYKYDIQNPLSSTTAKAIISDNELSIGDIISDQDYTIFQWVPRFVEDENNNIVFLYSNTNSYIEENEAGYNVLVDSEEDVSEVFGNKIGIWDEI